LIIFLFFVIPCLKQKKEVPIPLSTLQFKAIEGGVPEIFTPLLEYCDARNVTIRVGDIYINSE